jgi:hypothetical protein
MLPCSCVGGERLHIDASNTLSDAGGELDEIVYYEERRKHVAVAGEAGKENEVMNARLITRPPFGWGGGGGACLAAPDT